MRTCPYCKANSFEDQETCFGCLHKYTPDSAGKALQATRVSGDPLLSGERLAPIVRQARTELVQATTLPAHSTTSGAGMARLHVKMPEGYHYDIFLEKPEGASIQIGWIPDSSRDSLAP